MEKLSSILPTSPRVRNVDMTDAHPVRPGTPSYGRPIGANVLKDRFTLSEQAKDIAFKETLANMNPKEMKSVQIADSMSKNFFDTRPTDGIKTKPASEETQERTSEIDSEATPVIQDRAKLSAPEAALPGQRLDLEA